MHASNVTAFPLLAAHLLFLLAGCATEGNESRQRVGQAPAASEASASPANNVPLQIFDDFSYSTAAEMERNGWILRTARGWPGIPGASWNDNVVVGVVDPGDSGNRLVRMTASTDRKTTQQAQFCHQRKYYEGTYAARVHWRDAPMTGPNGDQTVQTFYLIAPLKAPLDADYSEVDFEYLANGGWGSPAKTLFVTTWETFRPEPQWLQVNTTRPVEGISREGWHTLVVHLANRQVTYFIDEEVVATHGEPYFPEEPMSINFNLWFIKDQLARSSEPRTWQQEVDWVFHEVGRVLGPTEVRARVADLRRRGVTFVDSVPARDPPLDSPCNF
jgi:hypothetical protein